MKNLFDKCILLMSLSLMCFLFAGLCSGQKSSGYGGFSSRDMYVELPRDWREPVEKVEDTKFTEILDIYDMIDNVPITVTYPTVVLYDSYYCFITAYCAEECGWSYMTSSGAECHRSDWSHRYDEPTTCAIDRNYFSYGTMFYVPSEDRVYIAEDTGAFRGLWLDLYQDDMSDVIGYNTRYETVYTCDYEYRTVTYYPNTNKYKHILLHMTSLPN